MDGAAEPAVAGDPHDDERLLARVRAGDRAAFESLYAAHAESARRLAVLLTGRDGADDLVADSFSRILELLTSGGGPTSNFRAYLHTAVRNRHRDNLRAGRERPSSDMPWVLDDEEPPAEELVPGIDANGAVAALTSLPGTWQQVLWYLEVEGRKPAEIAHVLDMSPVAVSSLAYRAREGLRRAYLDQHVVGLPVEAGCEWTRVRLSQYVRDDLSGRASRKVAEHLSGCVSCAAAFADVDTLNKKLAAFLLPVVLVGGMKALDVAAASGGAGAGPLAEALHARSRGESGSAATTAGAQAGGLLASANLSTLVVAAVTVGVVAVGATAWAVTANEHHGRHDHPVRATDAPGEPPAPSPSASASATPSPRPTPPSPSPTIEQPTTVPVAVVAAPEAEGPQPTPEPVLVTVRPRAPVAVPITACDTYGSLTLPTVDGVRYARTAGDGRQGPWTVTATATKGHAIADGAPTRFAGDLGQHFACPPSLGAVTKVSQGDPATDPWDITVTPVVTDPAPATLQVVYVFDTGVIITAGTPGAGWTCREPGGVEVGAGTEYVFPDPGIAFTCTFDYTGTAPPPVMLSVYGIDANMQNVEPTGSASLSRNGTLADQRTF